MRNIFTYLSIIGIILITVNIVSVAISGEKAPSFHLVSSEGKVLDSNNLRGKIILLNLITSHCPACHRQFTELRELHKNYPKLIIISVLLDNPGDLNGFKEENDITWYLALDTDNLGQKYNVMYTPTTVTIDKNGNIADRFVGWQEYSVLENSILNAGYSSSQDSSPTIPNNNGNPLYILFALTIGILYILFPMNVHGLAVEESSDWKFNRAGNAFKFSFISSAIFALFVAISAYVQTLLNDETTIWISVIMTFIVGIMLIMNSRDFFGKIANKIKGNIYKTAALSSLVTSPFIIPILFSMWILGGDFVISILISFISALIIGASVFNSEKRNSEKFIEKYWDKMAPLLGIIPIGIGAYLLYINL